MLISTSELVGFLMLIISTYCSERATVVHRQDLEAVFANLVNGPTTVASETQN